MSAKAHIVSIYHRFDAHRPENGSLESYPSAFADRALTVARMLGVCLTTATVATLTFISLCAPTVYAAEPPPVLWQGCEGQLVGGQDVGSCKKPQGIAVNQATGDVYFSDGEDNRIDEFTAWGEFVRAFGWDVNAKAPEEKLQTCTQTSGCLTGGSGSHVGEFDQATSVATDDTGNIYVEEPLNFRIEKFDPEGHFLLMFGGGVDEGPHHPGNLCTAAYLSEGDECGAGETGTADGQFAWAYGSDIAVGPDGTVYVGDKERIQEFNTGGEYTGEIKGGALVGETVGSLAVDRASEDLYVTLSAPPFAAKPNVLKLSHAGATLCTLATSKGVLGSGPMGLATDADGDLYVANQSEFATVEILEFGSTCKPITFEPNGPGFGSETIGEAIGLATSTACGIEGSDLYVANHALSNANFYTRGKENEAKFVRAYGPPPNPKLCPQPAVAPEIVSQFATAAGQDYAAVKAEINPHFWPDATFYVEYGAGVCSEGGCPQRVSYPGASLTSAIASRPITTSAVSVEDLSSSTTYHYRFVAQSGGGGPVYGVSKGGDAGMATGEEGTFTTAAPTLTSTTECANQALRYGRSAELPDCRAYEMVTPIDKQGADIEVSFSGDTSKPARLDQAASSGEALAYSSYRAFGEARAAPYSSEFIATRRAGEGWFSEDISPPSEGADQLGLGGDHDVNYKAFTEDLCDGWILKGTEPFLAPEAIPGYANLYRRDDCGGGAYETVSNVAPTGVTEGVGSNNPFIPSIKGFSADGSRTFFDAAGKLTGDASLQAQLYESYLGALRLVCYMPNGAPYTGSCTAGSGEDRTYNYDDSLDRAVSEDGARVYWSDAKHKLYVRLNPFERQSATSGGQCTEPAEACTLAVSSGSAFFWGAAAGGSSVLYTEGEAGQLYQAGVDEESSKMVVHRHLIAGSSLGVMGSSADGSLVYFASSEVLTEAQNSLHAKAQAGGRNLYLYRANGSGADSYTFIATLAKEDFERSTETTTPSSVAGSPYARFARVSADGLHAVFISSGSLTGYDNIDQNSGIADTEIFLFDAGKEGEVGRLRCISCQAGGARPVGRDLNGSGAASPDWVAAEIPGWEYDLHASRALSANGERVFFDSFDALVPEDTNGVEDVYEWERGESQTQCEALGAELYVAREGGCLSLISSGEGTADSTFVDADTSGSDVFFTTGSSLVPQDSGGQIDIYDARVNGGFPLPPAAAPPCEGEACQNSPAPPIDLTPASFTFSGIGNLAQPVVAAVTKTKAKTKPKQCKKGYVKKKGKCVKKPSSKKKKKAKKSGRRRK